MKIDLDEVLEAIELASDEFTCFYNKELGETVVYPDPLFTGIKDEELERELELNFDKYTRFPTKFEINEYHIMEEFIWTLPHGKTQQRLERAIRGKGAFRKFKALIYEMDLEPKWFAFEAAAYKRIAVDWCKDHGIQYVYKMQS